MMKRKQLYEKMLVPIGIVLLGCLCLTLGSIMANGNGTYAYEVDSNALKSIGIVLSRCGSFMVVNFPLWFALREALREEEKYTAAAALIVSYGTFLVVTMLVSGGSLASRAYSSILGISYTEIQAYTSESVTIYPLQTGLIGGFIAGVITRWSLHRVQKKAETHAWSALGENARTVLLSVLLCALAGAVIALIYPYFLHGADWLKDQIVNHASGLYYAIYGFMDQLCSVLNLNTIWRQPFWYGSYGGTWTSVAGTQYTGDINIWMAQLSAGSLTGTAGSYITPYYILHIFALPAGLLAAYTISTNNQERRGVWFVLLIAMVCSMFGGSDTAILLAMLFISPLLFGMHLLLSASLFALCKALSLYLGYSTANQITMAAQPGSLIELLSYLRYDTLQSTIIKVVIIGCIYAMIYFLVVRFYFRHLAIGLTNPQALPDTAEQLMEACGGLDNISSMSASYDHLSISLYDATLLQREKIGDMGIETFTETKDAIILPIGASSWMIRNNIMQRKRAEDRNI